MIVAAESGELLLFDQNEYRSVLAASPDDSAAIECIVPCSKGFVCGGDGGVLRIYERSGDDRGVEYKRSKVFEIEGHAVPIKSLAVSPNDENLVCSLANHQLFVLNLSNTDILKSEDMTFELLLQNTEFHSPGIDGRSWITGLDTCVRKPLVVTCGLDRTVRVWLVLTLLHCGFPLMRKHTDMIIISNHHRHLLPSSVSFQELH